MSVLTKHGAGQRGGKILLGPSSGERIEEENMASFAPYRIYRLPDGSLSDSNTDAEGRAIAGAQLAYAKGKPIPGSVVEVFGEGEPNASRRFRLGSDGGMTPVSTRDDQGNVDDALQDDDVKNDRGADAENKEDRGSEDKGDGPTDDELREGTNSALRDEIERRGLTESNFGTPAKLSRATKEDLLGALNLLEESESSNDDESSEESTGEADDASGDESEEAATD